MNGFAAFAGKEAREILRTWRIWVLPGILLFFALTGPVLARYTPELVGALAGDQLKGLVMPTPTYLDAYAQWVKNLSQIALFALIIIYGSIISSERKSGTAVLVLTKPVSRTALGVPRDPGGCWNAPHVGAYGCRLRAGAGIGVVVLCPGMAGVRSPVHRPD